MDAIRFLQILKDFDGKLERAEVVLPQTISWLHQFSMSDIDGLPNVIPYAGYRPARRRLKEAYKTEPIILAVF